jgi:serine kinase of HPr protein (carbohydrate metabolism regulator)
VNTRAVNVHATCVRLARAGAPFGAPSDAGVLILGGSGAGKSDLALRLIAAGAVLVADDRTDLFVRRARVHARPPKPIAGLIEVRGVGLVDVPYTEEVRIALVVELTARVARMPSPAVFRPPRSLVVPRRSWPPLIRSVAFEPSAPAKIAAAAAAFARGGVREIVKA